MLSEVDADADAFGVDEPLPRGGADWPEPLPVPVTLVEPVPPEASSSPTVTLTTATVPSNVATSDAPARSSLALASASYTVVRFVSSAAICSSVPDDLSLASCAAASATFASAVATAASSSVGSIVASTWPAVTLSPALTFTAVTVPAEGNDRSSVLAASTVPSAETDSVIEPRVTVETLFVAVVVATTSPPKLDSASPTTMTTTEKIAMATYALRLRLGTSATSWTGASGRVVPGGLAPSMQGIMDSSPGSNLGTARVSTPNHHDAVAPTSSSHDVRPVIDARPGRHPRPGSRCLGGPGASPSRLRPSRGASRAAARCRAKGGPARS